MPSFDASGYLKQEHGLQYSHSDDSGQPYYITPEGKEVKLDVNGLLKADGVPVDQFNIQYNSPDQAMDTALPDISTADRAKLAFGDLNGKAKYLREKGFMVAQDKDRNLVVNKNGTWHRLDPSGFEMADLAELGPEAIQTALQTAGSGLGLMLGNLPGAVVGGAAANYAGGELNARIGEWLGVRDDASMSIRDNVFDLITGAAPPVLGLGAKAVGVPLLGAVGNLVKKGLPQGSKALLEGLLVHGGVSEGAAKELFQEGSAGIINKAITETAAKAGTELGTTTALVERGVKNVGNLLKGNRSALEAELNNTVKTVSEATSGKFKIDLGSVVKDAEKELEQSGFGKILNTNVLEVSDKSLTDGMKKTLQSTLEELNRYKTLKTVGGPEAIKDIISMRAHLNNLVREVPTELKPYVKQVSDSISRQLSNRFEKQGAYEVYSKAVNAYETKASAVSAVEKMAAEEGGAKKLADLLLQNPNGKEAIHLVTQMQGDKGAAIANVIRQNMAASELVRKMPVVDAKKLFTTAAIGIGTGHLGKVSTIAGATLTPPRVIAKMAALGERLKLPKGAVDVAEKMKPMVDATVGQWNKLNQTQKQSIMFNPSALESILNGITESVGAQEELKQKLVQSGQQQ